jgi:putative (di)nucleoside polyphosphate hydrolase
MIMEEHSDYRPNVAAIVLSSDYEHTQQFVIARRTGMRRGWQFPQGGIDADETPQEALLRELREEIGTDEVDILGEYPKWIQYDFPPPKSSEKLYPFKGQRQRYFLVRLRNNDWIDLFAYPTPEFDAYKLVTDRELFRRVAYFKRPAYRRVIEYFRKKGYL